MGWRLGRIRGDDQGVRVVKLVEGALTAIDYFMQVEQFANRLGLGVSDACFNVRLEFLGNWIRRSRQRENSVKWPGTGGSMGCAL